MNQPQSCVKGWVVFIINISATNRNWKNPATARYPYSQTTCYVLLVLFAQKLKYKTSIGVVLPAGTYWVKKWNLTC